MQPLPDELQLALDAPLTSLRGVGDRVGATLAAAGLHTVRDLLLFFPTRHEGVTSVPAPRDEFVGGVVRFACTVKGATFRYLPRRRSLLSVTVAAADGTACEVAYFNQPYLRKTFVVGQERVAEGTLLRRGRRFVLGPGRLLPLRDGETAAVRLRYRPVEGVSEARLQGLLAQALHRADTTHSPLPRLEGALAAEQLPFASAVRAMHAPSSVAEHERARRFFAVHEARAVFAAIDRARRARAGAVAPAVMFSAELEARLRARLPLRWTPDQAAALAVVRRALSGPGPMGLLLQGDVGTGKTAVAVWAALAVVASGLQVALLAPTELLVEQHAAKVAQWLEGSRVRTALLSGSLGRAARRATEAAVAAGEVDVVFGTHALLSEATRFRRLGLVIIDEQHRFGVEQRQVLQRKGTHPHLLVLTATPIPRTLAFVLFGDLQVAELRARPDDRRPPVARHARKRPWPVVHAAIARRLARGQSAYVVCPAIGEDGDDRGALAVHRALGRHFACELVHGRMPQAARTAALQRFHAGAAGVLVGTTVLEVGIDVPHATLMVVVDAHRFGLATLHQLRGRVGRGGRRGLCVLLGRETDRTRALCSTTDGFALAELDLTLRGSGELLGLRQSGKGELRALDPVADLDLLLRVRAAAHGGCGTVAAAEADHPG